MSQSPDAYARKKEIGRIFEDSLEVVHRAVVDAGGVVVFEDENYHRRIGAIISNSALTRGMAEALFYTAIISGNGGQNADGRAMSVVEHLLGRFGTEETDPWWKSVLYKIEAGASYDSRRGDGPFTSEMVEKAIVILLKTKNISSENIIRLAKSAKSEWTIGHILAHPGVNIETSEKVISLCKSASMVAYGLLAYIELARERGLEPKIDLLAKTLILGGPVLAKSDKEAIQWILNNLPSEKLWEVISRAAHWHPIAVSEWLRWGGRGRLNEWPKATVKQLMGADSKEIRLAVTYALTSTRRLA